MPWTLLAFLKVMYSVKSKDRAGIGGSVFFGMESAAYARSIGAYKQRARTLYRQGKQLAKQKQYKQALQKHLAALEQIKRAAPFAQTAKEKATLRRGRVTFLYIIGKTYHLDKQYIKARDFYRRCLAEGPKPRYDLSLQ